MKKLIVISLLAIFGLALFVNAEQPRPVASDTTTVSTDTARVDTVRQMTVHLNHTITDGIKGE